MRELRANTEVIVTVGPAVAVGDGFTPITNLDVATADEAELLKHGSTSVVDISGATWAAVTTADGHYSLTITTSLSDTEGMLRVIIQDDSLCLPVKEDFMVLSEAAWDSKYVAKDSGYMDVNVKEVDGTAQRATDLAEIAQYLIANAATLTDIIADDSVLAQMLAVDGDISDYDDNTDSQEAIAVLLATIAGYLDTEIAAIVETLGGLVVLETTIGSDGRGTTSCRLAAGSDNNGSYIGMKVVLDDDAGDGEYVSRTITNYVATNKVVTWTPAITEDAEDGGKIWIIPGDTKINVTADAIEVGTITNATGADVATDVKAIKAETVLIVEDTNELQTDDIPSKVTAILADPKHKFDGPRTMDRPLAGDITGRFYLNLFDSDGNMEEPDAAPTVAAVNAAGTTRNANLDSTTMTKITDGRYRCDYTADNAHASEMITLTALYVEDSKSRYIDHSLTVHDAKEEQINAIYDAYLGSHPEVTSLPADDANQADKIEFVFQQMMNEKVTDASGDPGEIKVASENGTAIGVAEVTTVDDVTTRSKYAAP